MLSVACCTSSVARCLLHQFGLEMHPETEFAATYGARKAITFRFGIFTLGLCWALYAVRYLQPRWWPSASLMLSLRCATLSRCARGAASCCRCAIRFGGACVRSGGSFQSQSTRSTAYE